MPGRDTQPKAGHLRGTSNNPVQKGGRPEAIADGAKLRQPVEGGKQGRIAHTVAASRKTDSNPTQRSGRSEGNRAAPNRAIVSGADKGGKSSTTDVSAGRVKRIG